MILIMMVTGGDKGLGTNPIQAWWEERVSGTFGTPMGSVPILLCPIAFPPLLSVSELGKETHSYCKV